MTERSLKPGKFSFSGHWNYLKKVLGWTALILITLYLVLPLIIFDFGSTAVPYDEETFGDKQVAIGPRPYAWVPRAAYDLDIPGGFSYDVSGWPFRVWKPICIAFVKLKGLALPGEWR